MDANGYVCIWMPDHPKANPWGLVYEHILKAEEMLGRPLKDGEVVHHKDENRANNSYDNLLVFHDKANHTRFHQLHCPNEELEQLEDGSYICNNLKIVCPICGKPKDYKAKLCLECSQLAQRTVCRPARNELKQLIRTKSFVTIGKQYGVSDNAVRKWCDYEGLPRRKEDIKKYTDEEWAAI